MSDISLTKLHEHTSVMRKRIMNIALFHSNCDTDDFHLNPLSIKGLGLSIVFRLTQKPAVLMDIFRIVSSGWLT